MPYTSEIKTIRNSVGAVLRIHRQGSNRIAAIIVGTAWAIVDSQYFITAHHVLNNGQARDPNDKFYIFSVPGNGPRAQRVTVSSFPFEDSVSDMAILEVDPSSNQNFSAPALDITFRDHDDGEPVLTVGFPELKIFQARIDPQLNWRGGNMLLKSYANEGIIASQFEINNHLTYEFSIQWFQGESGGPIVSLSPLAVFSIMQGYRSINTVHGVVPGPHQGKTISLIDQEIRNLGGKVV